MGLLQKAAAERGERSTRSAGLLAITEKKKPMRV